jgi:hypothetical protein
MTRASRHQLPLCKSEGRSTHFGKWAFEPYGGKKPQRLDLLLHDPVAGLELPHLVESAPLSPD